MVPECELVAPLWCQPHRWTQCAPGPAPTRLILPFWASSVSARFNVRGLTPGQARRRSAMVKGSGSLSTARRTISRFAPRASGPVHAPPVRRPAFAPTLLRASGGSRPLSYLCAPRRARSTRSRIEAYPNLQPIAEGTVNIYDATPRCDPAPPPVVLTVNRITNQFHDPINGSMIRFAPIRHHGPCPGSEPASPASLKPQRARLPRTTASGVPDGKAPLSFQKKP